MNKDPEQICILIVDDDPDLLEMYKGVVAIDGVKTLTAKSGREAMDICKNNPGIRVIVSDSNMGEMSGMELLKYLIGYYQTMPVFYLLTGAFDISEDEVKKAGGAGLFPKPFDLDDFLERMKKDINL
jgi:DNA-binding NtrC family response regulator